MQSTSDQRGTSICSAAQTVGNAGGNGDHVFYCPANLHADQIVAEIANQVGAVKGSCKKFGVFVFGGGNGDSGWLI